MKKIDYRNLWHSFLHWRGWAAWGRFWVNLWKKTVSWGGWGKFFCLPFPAVLVLSLLSAAGLIWVFVRGMEKETIAYCIYPLSAYSLAALCGKIPAAIRGSKNWLKRHPKLTAFVKNEEFQFRLDLYFEQVINFAYGIFKIVSGVTLGSAWIGCDGIYNLTQSLIQLFQILRRRNPGDLTRQWRSYRVCGVLILLMHLTLTGIVFQMVNWNRAEEQGQIMVIATAAFAFYKITNSFIGIARDRKHVRPVDSSVRMLSLTQAIFAIFSLQASMFHAFGTGESWEHGMNILTGCAVCLSVASTGIYMIRRGTREIRNLQERNYGA